LTYPHAYKGGVYRAFREIIGRLRQREPVVLVACLVLLALIASGWLVAALERLFAR
jgi:hypothetical protein